MEDSLLKLFTSIFLFIFIITQVSFLFKNVELFHIKKEKAFLFLYNFIVFVLIPFINYIHFKFELSHDSVLIGFFCFIVFVIILSEIFKSKLVSLFLKSKEGEVVKFLLFLTACYYYKDYIISLF